MLSKKNNTIFKPVFGFLILTLAICLLVPSEGKAFEITIDVAPNVLNLQNNGQVVTVHTDIAYGLVQATTVFLNDVAIHSWKSDLRGNFVAKFVMEEIKNLPLAIDDYNTLTLVGYTTDGDSFMGSQDILVINNLPSNP